MTTKTEQQPGKKKIILAKIFILVVSATFYILELEGVIKHNYIPMNTYLPGFFLVFSFEKVKPNILRGLIVAIVPIITLIIPEEITKLFNNNFTIIPIVGFAIGALVGLIVNRMVRLENAKTIEQ